MLCDTHYVSYTMLHTGHKNNPEVLENLHHELRRGSLIVAVMAQLRIERYGYTLRKSLEEHGIAIEKAPCTRSSDASRPKVAGSEWREQDKRKKRFYRLSPQGEIVLTHLLRDWESLNASLEAILKSRRADGSQPSTASPSSPDAESGGALEEEVS